MMHTDIEICQRRIQRRANIAGLVDKWSDWWGVGSVGFSELLAEDGIEARYRFTKIVFGVGYGIEAQHDCAERQKKNSKPSEAV
ncbi:MAG: hypothetical protein AAFY34_04450 [Pseudomonadota bacterium]